MATMATPISLLQQPGKDAMITWPAALGRRFMVTVDTEEEFDWWGPFDRTATSVRHSGGIQAFQAYIEQAGVIPTYLCDYAIAQSDSAVEAMSPWIAQGTAELGAHLHPWINPPHDEVVCLANSYAGSLPRALERAKIFALRDYLVERFGTSPLIFRAGRYGLGANSAELLVEAGFRIDSSVRPGFDYRPFLGPDFMALPQQPYRAGPNGALIELPLSTAWLGGAGRVGAMLYPLAMRAKTIAGIFARLRLLSRVPLTPEGVSATSCLAAIDALLEAGLPLLNFSFHSPTLEPGNTVYCRTAAHLNDFYRWWDKVLDHLAKRGVTPTSPRMILAELDLALPAAPSLR
jgi:hypothetical protein